MFKFLLIDADFKCLDIPLKTNEYQTLNNQIRNGLCKDPVFTWNDYIIEGHQRYDLYVKYHTYYHVSPQFINSRPLALAWCCRKQLTRTDLTSNAESWLLYRLYLTELKIQQMKEAKDQFKYKQLSPSIRYEYGTGQPMRENVAIMEMISSEYKISCGTLRRYITYGRSLDHLEKMFPGVRNRILTGDLEVARVHVPDLIKMPRRDLKEMIENPRCHRLEPPKSEKNEFVSIKRYKRNPGIKLETGIKEMPVYDPDAELNGLVFTISAWKNAVSKAIENNGFNNATDNGKLKLKETLDLYQGAFRGKSQAEAQADHSFCVSVTASGESIFEDGSGCQ